MANVFRTSGPSIAYVTSNANSPRGTMRKRRTRRRRRRSSGSGKSKCGSPPPRSILLGSESGFVVEEDGYIVANFHVMERAYDMKLGLEDWNAYTVKFVSNITNYIMRKSPHL